MNNRNSAQPVEFEAAHALYLRRHLEARSGERRGRLERGHRYAEKLFLEKVWWPLLGSLDHLHPEYEIHDWNRRSQFLDFAFLPENGGKIGIECDGFQSHIKDMDRERFSYALNRDSFLTGIGWKMLHFAFDDIERRPEVCRMLLQLSLGPFAAGPFSRPDHPELSPEEKDVLLTAWHLGRAIRPIDLRQKYGFCHRKSRKILTTLAEQRLLRAVPGGKGSYVCKYETVGSFPEFLLR
ncbi:hypothetical protein QWJ34_22280 [Saccharibacillus sp. CPCC 101409]|uniref:hypothetical protein n=1 Tax=Saccharibacillus sp. CPCC 101409 TaxID=3058041 RepID=UPI0026720834|nr:hypothetical protein [Saccharibacillus sp. CPCC 101409]MDO3412509.1 hypothetical protein [Saccharibacillus sp. CPCC 101409]